MSYLKKIDLNVDKLSKFNGEDLLHLAPVSMRYI